MPLNDVLRGLQPKWVVVALCSVMAIAVLQQGFELNKIRQPVVNETNNSDPASASAGKQVPLLAVLAKQNLLGNPTAAPKPKVDPVVDNIPKTKLKLVLIGTIVETNNPNSALIQNSKKKTKRYYVGDEIEGGAKLYSVAADSIVIQRGTKLETLLYPTGQGIGSSKIPSQSQNGQSANTRKQSTKNQNNIGSLKSLKDRLKGNMK